VCSPVLSVVEFVLDGDKDPQKNSILTHRPLPALRDLLRAGDTALVFRACWALASILALGGDHIDSVIQHRIIPRLVGLLIVENADVFIPALDAIIAAVSNGTPDQIRILVGHGCIGPLCDFLMWDPAESLYPEIVKVLHVLERILRASADRRGANPAVVEVAGVGGLAKLRALRQHDVPEVRAGAIAILRTYFGGGGDNDFDDDEEEEEENGAESESDASGEADNDDDNDGEPPRQRPRMA
jgi:importin subunit alpha-6/7